mgnify:CR=1 FL=1
MAEEPAPTLSTTLARAAEFALASLVNLGWTWPNIAFALAATLAAGSGRFPYTTSILAFLLFVRLIRFPEGPMARTDAPATGLMVDLPTGATHYEWLETTSAGDAVPVIVVHGFSGDLQDVRPLAARIRDAGHRVLVYDLVGRGFSACRGERHTCRLFVSQLSELLAALQLTCVHLVGNSLGGGVCVEFARYFPQHVESLALVAPVGLRLAKRTYVLTRAPLVPDVLFRCATRRPSFIKDSVRPAVGAHPPPRRLPAHHAALRARVRVGRRGEPQVPGHDPELPAPRRPRTGPRPLVTKHGAPLSLRAPRRMQ